MTAKQDFYDIYHQKNSKFYKVIGENNFTYYEILRFFYDEVYVRILVGKESLSQLKILDVGCGVGTLALYFGSLGADVTGLDVSERAIKISENARKFLNMKNVVFKKELLEKGNLEKDMVITSEVIEHVENESEFLQNISSHLKENGLLYLTTPLKENLLYRIGFYKEFDKEVGHLRRYTVETIHKILEKNNFEVLAYRKVEGPFRNLLYVTKLGFLIKFIRGPFVPLFHFFDRLSMRIFGASNILLLARKK